MIWPVNAPISQGFSAEHPALDFASLMSDPVAAVVTGTVIGVGTDPNYLGGKFVIIREDHADGREYYTGHHSEILVSNGQKVTQGQVIAKTGMTGKATGPHVHFQVRHNNGGQIINPYTAFNERNVLGKGDEMAPYETANILAQAVLFRDMSREEWEKYHKGKSRNQLFDEFRVSEERSKRLQSLVDASQALKALQGLSEQEMKQRVAAAKQLIEQADATIEQLKTILK